MRKKKVPQSARAQKKNPKSDCPCQECQIRQLLKIDSEGNILSSIQELIDNVEYYRGQASVASEIANRYEPDWQLY